MIEVIRLTKVYRNFRRRRGVKGAILDLFHRDYYDTQAVRDVSFTIPPGEIVGYIGPNGAGKSTTIKILTGILRPTSGTVRVNGMVPWENRYRYTKQIGVVFGQRTQLWWDLAVIEAYDLLRRIYGLSWAEYEQRLKELDDLLELDAFLRLPVRKLSLGQRMRADLAASLLHSPPVLFLDEPTIGLDVEVKARVHEFIQNINRHRKTTIILTTHDLGDIEKLCERVILLGRGQVVYDGSLEDLRSTYGRQVVVQLEFDEEMDPTRFREALGAGVQIKALEKHRAEIEFDRFHRMPADVIGCLMREFRITDFSLKERNLSAIIMDLYGHRQTGRE